MTRLSPSHHTVWKAANKKGRPGTTPYPSWHLSNLLTSKRTMGTLITHSILVWIQRLSGHAAFKSTLSPDEKFSSGKTKPNQLQTVNIMSVCKLYQFCWDCSRNSLDSSPFEMKLIYLEMKNYHTTPKQCIAEDFPIPQIYIYIIIYIYMLNKCVGLMLKEIKKKRVWIICLQIFLRRRNLNSVYDLFISLQV